MRTHTLRPLLPIAQAPGAASVHANVTRASGPTLSYRVGRCPGPCASALAAAVGATLPSPKAFIEQAPLR